VTIRFVTGTDTGVGKTVACAALAAAELDAKRRVGYFKPVQTGCRSGDLGDADFVAAAAGIRAGEGLRYEAPLAPAVAAELTRVPISVDALVDMARGEHYAVDTLIVEGAGGLLTPLSGDFTMADLAANLAAEVIIVTSPRLGTLNHTALTVEVARSRQLNLGGIIVSGWPDQPSLLEQTNLERIRRLAPVLGVIPLVAGLDTAASTPPVGVVKLQSP
jgi:dethiobiotin synthase